MHAGRRRNHGTRCGAVPIEYSPGRYARAQDNGAARGVEITVVYLLMPTACRLACSGKPNEKVSLPTAWASSRVPDRLCCKVYQWAYGLPVGGYWHPHRDENGRERFPQGESRGAQSRPERNEPTSAAHAVNELIKPASVIATHVNEGATSDGKVKATSRTAAFIKLSNHPVHLALSGRMMEFDGSGKCVAGCS